MCLVAAGGEADPGEVEGHARAGAQGRPAVATNRRWQVRLSREEY